MVFDFPLPTPSRLAFQSHLSSPTHPSLPQAASTARHALRQALKKHKRLTAAAQRSSHLPLILAALNEYIPYLFALSRGLNGDTNNEENIEVLANTEIAVSWRPTLSSGTAVSIRRLTQRDSRVKGHGIDFELAFVLSTLGCVLSGLARTRCLNTLYAIKTPTAEEKVAAVTAATMNLLRASSVHSYLASSATLSDMKASVSASPASTSDSLNPPPSTAPAATSTTTSPPDLDPSTQSALSSLALAEATLLAVLKDDAYLSSSIQSRNPFDKEWMVKPPDIPKVRALLFARLCVRGAEYAERAAASAGATKSGRADGVDEELLGYMRVLARVGRAKACRFFGIDAEIAGRVGEGIAWLRAGRAALGGKGSTASLGGEGLAPNDGKGKGKSKGGLGGGFSKLRRELAERREERKVEKDAAHSKTGSGGEMEAELDWGDDAGRDEEARVIDMLEAKWTKMNDTVNTQPIPPSESYLSNLPSGRDIHSPPEAYEPPQMDAEQLARMRAPADPEQQQIDDASSDEEDDQPAGRNEYY